MKIKFSVVKPGLYNTLSPDFSCFRVISLCIAYDDEMIQEIAVAVLHPEVFLMVLHDSDQEFLGKFQIFSPEAAKYRYRVFHDKGYCLKQFFIHDRLYVRIIKKGGDIFLYAFFPFFLVKDYKIVFKQAHI